MHADRITEPDRFYHVSCVEHIFDLRVLLESKQLEHEGGYSITSSMYGGVNIGYKAFHMAIEDWFDSNGASSDLEEYEAHKEAHDRWKMLYDTYLRDHIFHTAVGEAGCSCGPAPEKPAYSTKQREPRLLSDVLAAVAKVKQIDGLPRRWLEFLSAPADESSEGEGSEGVSEDKGKQPLQPTEASTPTIKKASESEMKKRREELLGFLRKRKEEKMEKVKATEKEWVEAVQKQREEVNHKKVDEKEEMEMEVTKNRREENTDDEASESSNATSSS